jgi:hypothetical protein
MNRVIEASLANIRASEDEAPSTKTKAKPSHAANRSLDKESKAASGQSPAPSKINQVVALLQRKEGATLAVLTAATGWLPHTVRAALTGLKKKGHMIIRDKRGDVSCWHIGTAK